MIGVEVNYTRMAAVVELQDAQGWKSLSDTPRYRAQVDKVEVTALDVYTLIVDKIDLSDDIISTDQVIFEMNKALSDDAPAIDAVIFEMNKPLSDDITADDSIIFSMNKVFSDNATPSDSQTFSMNKALSDNAAPTDSVNFNLLSDGDGGVNDFAINEAAIDENVKITKVFTA